MSTLLPAYVMEILSLMILTVLITLPLSALLLFLTTKLFKLQNQSYKTALFVVVIVFIVNFIFGLIKLLFKQNKIFTIVSGIILWILISFLFAWWLIKTKYNIDWKKAFLVWLIWVIFASILGFIISILLSIILNIMISSWAAIPTGNIILDVFK